MTLDACIYKGSVFHKRFSPKPHELRYSVFTLFADIDDLKALSDQSKFFSLNKFNLMSLYEKDYGDPNDTSGQNLKDRLLSLMSDTGISVGKISKIKLLTYPRINGFVFNPLTVFYCSGKNDEHLALIYEVRNTFGERHNYIYEIPDGKTFTDAHQTQKCFHVSPFFDRDGDYKFKINDPGDVASVLIDYHNDHEILMTANFIGKKVALSDKTILSLCLKAPFMTVKVVAGILFEAMRLKFKGLKVFSHPEDHEYQATLAMQTTKSNLIHPQTNSSSKKDKE